MAKLASKHARLTFCYEAGPTGYGLYRLIKSIGHDCIVVAPSLIPSKPGDRVKTNRRDAVNLVKLLRAGELTAVWVPDERHEAMRDLVRARDAAVKDYKIKRQNVSSLLLRLGRHYPGKKAWGRTHILYRRPTRVHRFRPPAWSRLSTSRCATRKPELPSSVAGQGRGRQCAQASRRASSAQCQRSGRSWHYDRPAAPVVSASCNVCVLTAMCSAAASARGLLPLAPANIAGTRRGSDRAGSRHLAAGSRRRLRACRCRSGGHQDAVPVADGLTVAGVLDRGRETAALATGGGSTARVSAILFVPVASGQVIERHRFFEFRKPAVCYSMT